MLDWNDFRIVLAISREKTLSAAARSLKVDQSTVGRRLAAFESAAGTRLFDRTPDGYLLTAAGEAIREAMAAVETQALSVERKLAGGDARLEGVVRLATSDSFATWFVVPRLRLFRARFPGIMIELLTGNPPVSLARREAELSLRLSKPTEPNLVARRIGSAAWAAYASDAYLAEHGAPDPRTHFVGHEVVGYQEELARTVGAQWLRERADRAAVVLTSNSLVSHARAVLAGLGVGALPCIAGDVEPSLRRLSGVIGHHGIWLVVHPNVRHSARVRAAMSFLSEIVKDEAELLSGRAPGRNDLRARATAPRARR
jgi:DNA-binding transcriptional LysR family regulator